MEIFKYNICFRSWGEIYLGIKQQWITSQNVFDYCISGHVKSCDDDRLVKLYLAFEESLFVYYEQIKDFIEEDNATLITKNEDERERDFQYIPYEYWDLWKLEFLLRIKNGKYSKEDALDKIVEYYYLFDFPDEWTHLLYFQPPKENESPVGINGLYERFLEYIDAQLLVFGN